MKNKQQIPISELIERLPPLQRVIFAFMFILTPPFAFLFGLYAIDILIDGEYSQYISCRHKNEGDICPLKNRRGQVIFGVCVHSEIWVPFSEKNIMCSRKITTSAPINKAQ